MNRSEPYFTENWIVYWVNLLKSAEPPNTQTHLKSLNDENKEAVNKLIKIKLPMHLCQWLWLSVLNVDACASQVSHLWPSIQNILELRLHVPYNKPKESFQKIEKCEIKWTWRKSKCLLQPLCLSNMERKTTWLKKRSYNRNKTVKMDWSNQS